MKGLVSTIYVRPQGGAMPAARNVIAGNANMGIGIVFPAAEGNTVQGNFIGTDVTGDVALPNDGHGIVINQAANNLVGGATSAARNLISANGLSGIDIVNTNGPNFVQGNFIGTAVDGTSPLGNGSHGVFIGPIVRPPASNSTVGGMTAGTGNIIAHNNSDGVFVESGTGNAILGNSIFSNDGLGIDLSTDGVTFNDIDDPDTGANNLQNYPVLDSATITGTGMMTISGSLNSTSSSDFRVAFLSNSACDPSGYGEGERYLGFVTSTTDVAGMQHSQRQLPRQYHPAMSSRLRRQILRATRRSSRPALR